jgi:TetR/AcrR family transcriptional repressor of nem operon
MVMKQNNDTRGQIMDRAAQLLMSRGYKGFSYRDISSHLGVKNAAVHYHFPAKTDLALALVDEYRQTLRP